MALRGKEETFVRRFAAGGNDGVPFDPRGYGDHSRKFTARGNEMVDHENKCESDDGYHPRRFVTRGNEDHDLLYDSSPIFYEYEDDVWYAWATGGSYRCGFDEAVFSYQKALTVFKASKGDNHPAVASVFVRLADLYYKTGKLRESRSYCENALRIYAKPVPGTSPEDIASGMTEISAIYESFNEPEEALKLLQKSMKLLEDKPGQQSTIAGVEARMGVMFYMVGGHEEARAAFESAVAKLRASGERKSTFFGVVLNQIGLACVQLFKIDEAVRLNENSLSPKIAGMFVKKIYVYVAVYSLVTGGDTVVEDGSILMVNGCGSNETMGLSEKSLAKENIEYAEMGSEIRNYSRMKVGDEVVSKTLIMKEVKVTNAFVDNGLTVSNVGGPEPGETTFEVKLFRRVVMLILNWNRVDIPFDPGGYGSKAKLEDGFFF